MVKELKWRSLQQRRVDNRLAKVYKMRNGSVGIDTRSILVPMLFEVRLPFNLLKKLKCDGGLEG